MVNVPFWGFWTSLLSICWRVSAIVGWCSSGTCMDMYKFLIGTTHCHTCSLGLDFGWCTVYYGIEYRMATYGTQKWLVTGYSMVLLVLPHVTGMFYWFLPQLAWLLPFASFWVQWIRTANSNCTWYPTQSDLLGAWHSCSTDDIANDFRPKRFVSRDRLIKTEHSKREYRRKKSTSYKLLNLIKHLLITYNSNITYKYQNMNFNYITRRRMARERRGAGSSLVSMETQF